MQNIFGNIKEKQHTQSLVSGLMINPVETSGYSQYE